MGKRSRLSAGERGDATTIYLVRHAEVHNPEQVLYGRLPRFRLSEAGRRQAERAAAWLADKPLVAIYSSPLLRARQTADLIARCHPTATQHISTLLHEVGSSWQGTRFRDFKPGFNTYDNRREPGDESIERIQARMERFLARARRRHAGQQIACVSHGDPITIARVALSGRPVTLSALRGGEYAGLCSITELVYAPGAERPRLRCLVAPTTSALSAAAGK